MTFITIEGIEASGKSTLVSLLAVRLEKAGTPALVTREPGGTPLGEQLRGLFLNPQLAIDPIAEALLLNASRAQLVATTIGPALARSEMVLCDRFFDATLAYQGYGRGLDLAILRSVCVAATGGLVPDRTILVDLPVEVALERVRARAFETPDRLEREGVAFHERVRNGYLELARAEPARFRIIDGLLPPEALADRAWHELALRG